MKTAIAEHADFFNFRVYFTAFAAIASWSLLGWSYYHGGVPRHHILADKDLPFFSNWWGGILLPLLTWFLLYRLHKRLGRDYAGEVENSKYPNQVVYGFAGALIFGILLSVFFTFQYTDLAGNLLLALLLLALFLPIYRAECLLGFVIGMTFTFGGVLPIIIGSILVAVSAVLYLLARPGILYVASSVARVAYTTK